MYSTDTLLALQKKLLFGRQMFDVELTTECNKKCPICPREKFLRSGKMMTEETFSFLCDWLPLDCDVFFAGFGEPLLHESCAEFVKMLKLSGRRTSIMTNGRLLSEENICTLFNSGLDRLQVSIIQKNGIQSILHFMHLTQKKHHKNLVFNIISEAPELVSEETSSYLNTIGANFCVKKIHNRAGFLFHAEHTGELASCATFFCDTFISADGDIFPCSNDINGEHRIGSIKTMSFGELTEYKKSFLGNTEICPLCIQCTDEYRLKHFLEVEK